MTVRTEKITSFASGEFTGLPLPTGAEAFMPVNHKDGVATQSYEVPGLTAEGVLRYYEEYLAADEWTNTEPPHASGTVGWMGAWIDVDGRLLEVSAVPLALDEPDSTVTQFSLVLHEDAAAGG